MSNFIEVSTNEGDIHLINRSHIRRVTKEAEYPRLTFIDFGDDNLIAALEPYDRFVCRLLNVPTPVSVPQQLDGEPAAYDDAPAAAPAAAAPRKPRAAAKPKAAPAAPAAPAAAAPAEPVMTLADCNVVLIATATAKSDDGVSLVPVTALTSMLQEYASTGKLADIDPQNYATIAQRAQQLLLDARAGA